MEGGSPVLLPSSITRNFIFPREMISPVVAGTNCMGTVCGGTTGGIFACLSN